MRRIFLFLVLLWGSRVFGQATQIASGPVEPATCDPTVGQLFFNNSTVPAVLKYCSGTNVWAAVGAGTGGTSFPWTTLSSTGTPSLSVTNGSANYFMSVTSNVTGVTIAGTPTNGEYIGIDFKEDATGGRTIPLSSFPGNFIFPTGCALTTTANANNWLAWTYDGTNWQPVPGSCVPLATTLSIKPQANDNICYVSGSNGNDSNDGLSIGTAKLTVYSCLTTVLPGGTATTAGNGTILISGSASYGGPVSNQGMWLMGTGDPNSASPPSGWLKFAPSQAPAITIDCFSASIVGTHGHTAHCGFTSGTYITPNFPAVWISTEAGNITINNITFNGFANTYIRYGIDSNNNRNGTGGSSGFAMRNVTMSNGNCSGGTQTGPSVDIGSNSFWIWMKEMTIGGCPAKIFSVASSGAVRSAGTTTITTTTTNDLSTGELATIANVTDDSFNGSFTVTVVDSTHFTYSNVGPNTTSGTGQVVTARSASINIDSGTTGSGSGLIFIDDTNLNNGNIRYAGGVNGGSFYVRNLSYEGASLLLDAPVVLITGTSATANADGTSIRVDNVEVSDATTVVPGVQVDNASNYPDLVIVSRIAKFVRGKMTVLGGTSVGLTNSTYLRQQQFGLRQGLLTSNGDDAARRGFSPVVVLGTNIAITSPSSWTFSPGVGTVTSGISAPDKTTNAGRVTGTGAAFIQFYGSTTALNLNDIYVFGAWARSNTTNGYPNGTAPIKFIFNNNGLGVGDACVAAPGSSPGNGIVLGSPMGSQQSDGQWQWYSGVCKVAANPTTPGLFFGGSVDSTHTVDFYAPTLILFPSGTISDNESYEIAQNLQSFPSSASAGEIAMLDGHIVRFGPVTFANLGSPNNGDFAFCPDCVQQNPCAGSGNGAFAQRINGVWNCSGGAGGVGTGTQFALTYWATTSSLGSVPSNVSGQIPTAQTGAAPTFTSPSFTDSVASPVVTTPYTLACDSATSLLDRGHSIRFQSGASAITIPLSTAAGCAGFVTTAVNDNAASLTFTRTTGDTLTVCNGASCSDAQTSFTLTTGQDATIAQNATNLWLIRIHTSGGGVSSFTGDGALLSNSSSTGAVIDTLALAAANKVWGNCTNSLQTPSYCGITLAMLPTGIPNANLANPSTTVNTQTCTLGSTCTIGFANIAAGAIANGSTCTTQSFGDTTTDCATDAFVQSAISITDTAGTITSGHLACYTSTNTAGNCTGLAGVVGVFINTTTFRSFGEMSVALDTTQNVTFGDNLCASSTSFGTAHDNGVTACTTGLGIGIVKTTASSVSSATAYVTLR